MTNRFLQAGFNFGTIVAFLKWNQTMIVMKRKILRSVLGAILIIGLSNQKADAQSFVASFGVQQTWGVPISVVHYVDDYYYGYEWVHTRQIVRHGVIDFQVILQRGPVFIEITLDRFGRVYRTVRRDYYPLVNHVCGPSCGYHVKYYRTHYAACSGHSHHGHNHVVYYKRPRGNAYGYYKKDNPHMYRNDRGEDHRRDESWNGSPKGGKYNDGRRGDHGKGNYNGSSGGYGKGTGNGHSNGSGYGRGNGDRGGYNKNGRSGSDRSSRSSNYKGGRKSTSSSTTRVRGSGRN